MANRDLILRTRKRSTEARDRFLGMKRARTIREQRRGITQGTFIDLDTSTGKFRFRTSTNGTVRVDNQSGGGFKEGVATRVTRSQGLQYADAPPTSYRLDEGLRDNYRQVRPRLTEI